MNKKYVTDLTDLLWQIEDKKHLDSFVEDLLTEKELKDIADRVKILRLLRQGKTQRAIAEELWISVTTVNRWAKVLKNGTWAFKDLKITL